MSTTTTFECMANELLIEIFEYFDWYSLYLSFSLLNSRFDAVLACCYNIYVDLDNISSSQIVSHLGRHLLPRDPRQIAALRSSIQWHIELVLRDDLILNRFSSIRSLTLIKINDETAELLLMNSMSHLRANLVYLFLSFDKSNTWNLFLSVYPKLRQCFLPNATFSSKMINSQSNMIQVLQINHVQSKINAVATNLLVHSPHLRRLNLHVKNDSFIDYDTTTPCIPPSSPSPSILTHLTITSSSLYFSTIEWLLTYAPRLRTFHVRATSSCILMILPIKWEQVLSSEIRQLDVKVEVTGPFTLFLKIVGKRDFWQLRKWHVEYFHDPSPSFHIHS